jgi:ketosteroid isomerase-like protein
MSEENVEVVRSAYEFFNRGDVAGVLTVFDPNVEWDMTEYELWLESDRYLGHEGVGAFLSDWATIFPDYRADIERLIDVGDQVLVFVTQRGHGTGSGVRAELSYWQVLTVRNGKIVRVRVYSDGAPALAAVGLAE